MVLKPFPRVLFEREVLLLFNECYEWYNDSHNRPLKGLTLRMFTGFLRKEGVVITPARGSKLKFHKNEYLMTDLEKIKFYQQTGIFVFNPTRGSKLKFHKNTGRGRSWAIKRSQLVFNATTEESDDGLEDFEKIWKESDPEKI